jgi:hypothetical protein
VKGDGCAELGLHQKPSDEVGCIPVGNLLLNLEGGFAEMENPQTIVRVIPPENSGAVRTRQKLFPFPKSLILYRALCRQGRPVDRGRTLLCSFNASQVL